MYLDTILQPVLRHLTSHSISSSSDQANQWREWRRLRRWFNSTHTNSSFSHPHFMQCFGLLNELLYDSEIWQKDFARMGPIFHGIGSVCHWLLFTYWTKYARIPFDLPVSLDILAVARLSGLALCAWSDPRRVIWTLYHISVHFHIGCAVTTNRGGIVYSSSWIVEAFSLWYFAIFLKQRKCFGQLLLPIRLMFHLTF